MKHVFTNSRYMRNVTQQMNSQITWRQKRFSTYIMPCGTVTLNSKAVKDNTFYQFYDLWQYNCDNLRSYSPDFDYSTHFSIFT